MGIIKQIYTALVPGKIRVKLADERKRKKIISYYNLNPTSDQEINEALDFLKNNALAVLPYPFHLPYFTKDIDVKYDELTKFPYVIHGAAGNKLFFKKSWEKEHIIACYRTLLAEQDLNSAHRYLTSEYGIDKNSTVVDVGAAEGIFALDEMENISHLYLIETDPEWIEALLLTYKPWEDRITIIEKYVSNVDDEKNVKLDTYFKNIDQVDFIKVDVDGAEQDLIYGAEDILSNKVKKIVICTYHKENDNRDFGIYFKKKNYQISNSNGYMLFHYIDFAPPFFRRGVLRAQKNK